MAVGSAKKALLLSGAGLPWKLSPMERLFQETVFHGTTIVFIGFGSLGYIYIYIYIIDERTQLNNSPLNHKKFSELPDDPDFAGLRTTKVRKYHFCILSLRWLVTPTGRPTAHVYIAINSYIHSTMTRTSNNHDGRHVCAPTLPRQSKCCACHAEVAPNAQSAAPATQK